MVIGIFLFNDLPSKLIIIYDKLSMTNACVPVPDYMLDMWSPRPCQPPTPPCCLVEIPD